MAEATSTDTSSVVLKPTVNIGILRNVTIEALSPLLKKLGDDSSVDFQITYGGFDTAVQDSFQGDVIDSPQDYLVVCLHKFTGLANLCERFSEMTEDDIEQESQHYLANLTTILNNLSHKQPAATIAVHNIELFGYPEKRFSQNPGNECQNDIINRLNQELKILVQQYSQAFIVDNDLILRRIGNDQFYDQRYWYFARAPFTQKTLHQFTLQYNNVLEQQLGKRKKCLILDCDNTLWGGVIGEDGITGIHLGDQGKGLAFKRFQQFLRNLSNNGFILALCSKNNEEDVWKVFEKHPDMALKKQHIAAHRINWNSKDKNIIELASELNIGLDSMVFIDDNDFETQLINHALPHVSVIQVDAKNPSDSIRLLQKSEYVTLREVIKEDTGKLAAYQQQKIRQDLKSSLTLEEYLSSLETQVTIRLAAEEDTKRIAQMSQKTNQFNLTTERLSESEVQNRIRSEQWRFFLLEASDRYGDMGIVGYMNVQYDFTGLQESPTANIANMALSCRALGRNLELTFINSVLNHLQKKSINTITASYQPSPKNQQVRDFYSNLDFESFDAKNNSKESEKNVSIRYFTRRLSDFPPAQPVAYISLNTHFE